MTLKSLIFLVLFSTMFLFIDGKNVNVDKMSISRSTSNCPCSLPEMCLPITDTKRKEVFAFSVKNDSNHWEQFEWDKVTTVAMTGYYSAELMCMAHSFNARISYLAGVSFNMTDPALRHSWIEKQITYIQQHFFDGINIDYEGAIHKHDKTLRDAFTSLVAELNTALKKVLPHSQLTVDVPCRVNYYGRYYDYAGLANNSDFLFVMDYDEQDEGYVAMSNSAFFNTLGGMQTFNDLGITNDKLVLGVPWYGYIYSCVRLQGDNCFLVKNIALQGVNRNLENGKQYSYPYIKKLSESADVKWNTSSLTPYFTFKDPKSNLYYQAQYDIPKSLYLKYQMALALNLRGVGIWTIDLLDYSNTPAGRECRQEMFGVLPQYPKN